MYRAPSKRKQLMQRIVVYGLMTIAIVSLVTALVFYMLGYRFSRDDGKIEQGGLVQFDTQPNGATVTIDGITLSTKTPSKTTSMTGPHYVTMNRDGYKQWQKSVAVSAGGILWLNYARLIPNDLPQTSVADYKSVSDTLASPNNKWMAIKEVASTPDFSVADLSKDTPQITKVSIPKDAYTASPKDTGQTFVFDSWNQSSKYLLVKHTYQKNKVEWIVVDVDNPSNSKNITTLFDVNAVNVEFSATNGRIVYALINNDVRRLDIDAETLSRPLITDAAEFAVYDNNVLTYTTLLDKTTEHYNVGYYTEGASKARTVMSYPKTIKGPIHVALGKYFGDTFIAIATGETISILKGDLPSSDSDSVAKYETTTTLTVPGGVQYLTMRTNGRFVIAQHGDTYTVYDIELKKMTSTKLKGTSAVKARLNWIDNYSVWSDRDGMVRLYEFDGGNQQDIMPVVPGYDVTLSPNDTFLYGITKDKKTNTFHLSRVRLILS